MLGGTTILLLGVTFGSAINIQNVDGFDQKVNYTLSTKDDACIMQYDSEYIENTSFIFNINFDLYVSSSNPNVSSIRNLRFSVDYEVANLYFGSDEVEIETTNVLYYDFEENYNPISFLDMDFSVSFYREDNLHYVDLLVDNVLVAQSHKDTLPLALGELRITFDLSIDSNVLQDTFRSWQGLSTEYWFGYDQGYIDGEQVGYTNGVNDTLQNGSVASEIFAGIVNVGLLPINVFLGMLNLEVFGINIGALVTALMTIAITIIIVRLITGKKND